MKNPVILVLSLIVLVLMLVGPVWAATTGTINVTVTPKLISLSVSPASYNYGTLGLSNTTETTGTFSVENTGNVDEDFDIKGFDTADWTLNGTPGEDLYEHDWKEGAGSYAALTTSNTEAAGAVGPLDSASFKFQLHMPTLSSSNAAQAPNVTFTASES